MESYHLFRVHPETLEPWTPTRGAYYIAGSAPATVTGGTYKGQDDYLLVSLPPAFVGAFDRDGFMWLAVHPIDTHRCAVRAGGAFASRGPAGVLDRVWESVGGDDAGAHGLLDFVAEDKAICERVQRGVGGDFVPGRLVPLERVVEDFGHYLNWRLNGVEPPAVHSESSPCCLSGTAPRRSALHIDLNGSMAGRLPQARRRRPQPRIHTRRARHGIPHARAGRAVRAALTPGLRWLSGSRHQQPGELGSSYSSASGNPRHPHWHSCNRRQKP